MMTLNVDQKRIIEARISGYALVKGVAGSGKTTVALYRTLHLLKYYCEPSDRILLVTYAKTLTNYIDNIYKKVVENEVEQFILGDYTEKVDVRTIDQIIYRLYANLNRSRIQIASPGEVKELLKRSIQDTQSYYPQVSLLDSTYIKFIEDEIDWIKSCRYTDMEVYLTVDRAGRGSGVEKEGPQRLGKGSDTRKAIYEVMVRYDQYLNKLDKVDFKTMALKVLEGLEQNKINVPEYCHVIIDESQDLTRTQLEIIKYLVNEKKKQSNIIFLSDTAQSIYGHSWLSSNSFKSIGFDMQGRARVLSKNYRTTKQIALAAYSMIEKDDNITSNDDYVKAVAIEINGDKPIVKGFNHSKEEATYVAEQIKNKLIKEYNLSDIAIISRNTQVLYEMQNQLNQSGVPAQLLNKSNPDFHSDFVKLVTMHSIKGLEFKVIFIVGVSDGIIPYNDNKSNLDENMLALERRLFYVGMTRAKEKLHITYHGKPSTFLLDIDPEYVSTGEKAFEQFYRIGVDKYRMKNQLQDLYGKEEMVRQWAIDELVNKLNYPQEYIDIEYKMQVFSATGYGDIVVHTDQSKRQPWIIGECKAPYVDISKWEKQLLGYMETSPKVKYGFLTNGIETCFYCKKKYGIEVVKEIPSYDGNNQIEDVYVYTNLKNHQRYYLSKNKEDMEEITVCEEQGEVISYKELSQVDVYGKVAAGTLQHAYEERLGGFVLPYIPSTQEHFILEVDGKSMINAGIHPGDYVVVKRQNYADNMNIVVAVVGEDATLKKFLRSGNHIMLLPENNEYQPIIVQEKDLQINGIVVGVIRKNK